jgi:hypothetical protein
MILTQELRRPAPFFSGLFYDLTTEGKVLGLGREDRNWGKSGRILPLSKNKKNESPLITPESLILYSGTDFAIEITKLSK